MDRPHQTTQISTTTTNSLQTDSSICDGNIRSHLQQHIKSNDGSSDNKVNTLSSSNAKSNLASDSDVSPKQTPSYVSLGLTHALIDANNLECDLFSVTEPSTTKTILQK